MDNIISLAQCVGLWLAEGSRNSISEITFTNNQYYLIKLFHRCLKKTLTFDNKPRIYVYSKTRVDNVDFLLKNIIHKFYVDKRANKPYFIYRVSGRKLVKSWLKLTDTIIHGSRFYTDILQGFFAVEGNIKYIEKSKSRVLRIAQGKRMILIEKILEWLNIKFSYSETERAYIISGRKNLEKLMEINISKLHIEKHKKFVNMLKTYKQNHYSRGELKKMLLNGVNNAPKTSNQLSKIFLRDPSRITKVLSDLKKYGKVKNYRVGSSSYWTGNKNIVIISDRKKFIIETLKTPKRTSEISKLMQADFKSASRRLKELERLNLVRRYNGLWSKRPIDKEVVVYRIRNGD